MLPEATGQGRQMILPLVLRCGGRQSSAGRKTAVFWLHFFIFRCHPFLLEDTCGSMASKAPKGKSTGIGQRDTICQSAQLVASMTVPLQGKK